VPNRLPPSPLCTNTVSICKSSRAVTVPRSAQAIPWTSFHNIGKYWNLPPHSPLSPLPERFGGPTCALALQDTSNAIWAMAQLNHHPGKEMLQGVAYYALRHWPQMKAPEAVRILGALAQLCGCPAATWEALLAKLGAMKVSSFQEADLQQIYQMHCLVTASREPPLLSVEYRLDVPLLATSLFCLRSACLKGGDGRCL